MSSRSILSLAFLLPLTTGCSGAMWGNLAVLGVSVGIFMGTLSLGRQSDTSARRHESPKSTLTPRP